MNTHQKIFFSCAVTLGVVAAAFASSPVPNTAVAQVQVAHASMVVAQVAPEVTLERALVLGRRSELVASNDSTESND